MKILIIGHKGSGKTVIGKILADKLGVESRDSSTHCFEKVVYPILKEKYGYKDKAEAMDDKDNRREDWFDLIAAYNTTPDRVTREILEEADIYTGMRNRREFEGSRHLFDLIVWVDASDRIEAESIKSMELTADDADYILNNNLGKVNLINEVERLISEMIRPGDYRVID